MKLGIQASPGLSATDVALSKDLAPPVDPSRAVHSPINGQIVAVWSGQLTPKGR